MIAVAALFGLLCSNCFVGDVGLNAETSRGLYRLSCEEEKRQMAELHQKRMKLEAFVESSQENNEEYIKIIKAVEEKVARVLSNAKVLLRYAFVSITESIRNDPERYRSLFYNMSPSITDCYSNSSQDILIPMPMDKYNNHNSTHHLIILLKLM
jgi:hypothetical protein